MLFIAGFAFVLCGFVIGMPSDTAGVEMAPGDDAVWTGFFLIIMGLLLEMVGRYA